MHGPFSAGGAWHEARFLHAKEDPMLARTILVAAVAALVAAGTAGAGESRSELSWGHGLASLAIQIAAEDEAPPDADNTGRNVRDRDDRTLTPTDQGNSASDRTITAQIRREIVANDALSTNAHNVKIITTDGVVTLRGPVKTAREKATVGAVAQRASGVRRVDNQLEIERAD
jgi:hyperosmotically inducible periplasmic protein